MRRKALLIGITYAGTSAHLNGCVNDVVYMQTCLVRNFGFDPKMIFILWYAAPALRGRRDGAAVPTTLTTRQRRPRKR